MKILYVDMRYDYGNKERGINQIGQLGFRQSFVDLGNEVFDFYYDEYLDNTAPLQEKLIEYAKEVNPELIFFCLYKDQFTKETLAYLKNKYKTMNWFGDDTWRFDSFSKEFAPFFTYSITTDKFSVPRYKDLATKVIYSQWAAIKSKRRLSNTKYSYDVSFVGGIHPVRAWYIDELKKAGLKINCFGYGWPNGPISLDEMNKVFAESKVNLNLSNSNSKDVRYLFSGLKPLYHSLKSKKDQSQVKARHFEIPYFGGFQISEYVPGIEDYLDIGKELAVYKNLDEAIHLVKFYLRNDDLREKIKMAGISRAEQNTYQDRFKKIMEQL